jgi:hypothetical protein
MFDREPCGQDASQRQEFVLIFFHTPHPSRCALKTEL